MGTFETSQLFLTKSSTYVCLAPTRPQLQSGGAGSEAEEAGGDVSVGGVPGEQVSLFSACVNIQGGVGVRCKNVRYIQWARYCATNFRDYQENGETKTETTYTYSEFVGFIKALFCNMSCFNLTQAVWIVLM